MRRLKRISSAVSILVFVLIIFPVIALKSGLVKLLKSKSEDIFGQPLIEDAHADVRSGGGGGGPGDCDHDQGGY